MAIEGITTTGGAELTPTRGVGDVAPKEVSQFHLRQKERQIYGDTMDDLLDYGRKNGFPFIMIGDKYLGSRVLLFPAVMERDIKSGGVSQTEYESADVSKERYFLWMSDEGPARILIKDSEHADSIIENVQGDIQEAIEKSRSAGKLVNSYHIMHRSETRNLFSRPYKRNGEITGKHIPEGSLFLDFTRDVSDGEVTEAISQSIELASESIETSRSRVDRASRLRASISSIIGSAQSP